MAAVIERYAAAFTLAALFAAHPAHAHDVTYDLHGDGEARVAFRYQDGSPMAGATVEIFAPASGGVPEASGTTDPNGEVAVRTGRDGIWRVEANDRAGHASRARLDVVGGVVSLAGQSIPDWLATISLLGNVVLLSILAFVHQRRRVRSTVSVKTRRGPVPI